MKAAIAFDLDGIFVDKPPLIPKKLIEYLFRGIGYKKNNIYYRFPSIKIEQYIRKISHTYWLRPPIRNNIQRLQAISKTKKYQIYLISARYSFLIPETYNWLQKYKIDKSFAKIILNKNNQQPHLFKQKKLNKLRIQYYFEDDKTIYKHLKKNCPFTKIYLVQNKKLPNRFLP